MCSLRRHIGQLVHAWWLSVFFFKYFFARAVMANFTESSSICDLWPFVLIVLKCECLPAEVYGDLCAVGKDPSF